MTDVTTMPTDADKPLVLDAIRALGKDAYGINIQTLLLADQDNPTFLPLDTLYEVLIDLLDDGQITSEKITYADTNGWRKLFKLTDSSQTEGS